MAVNQVIHGSTEMLQIADAVAREKNIDSPGSRESRRTPVSPAQPRPSHRPWFHGSRKLQMSADELGADHDDTLHQAADEFLSLDDLTGTLGRCAQAGGGGRGAHTALTCLRRSRNAPGILWAQPPTTLT